MVWRKYPYEINNTSYIYYNLAHLTRARELHHYIGVVLMYLMFENEYSVSLHPSPTRPSIALTTGKNKCIFKTNNIIWTIQYILLNLKEGGVKELLNFLITPKLDLLVLTSTIFEI